MLSPIQIILITLTGNCAFTISTDEHDFDLGPPLGRPARRLTVLKSDSVGYHEDALLL